jgi:hypothetical protein
MGLLPDNAEAILSGGLPVTDTDSPAEEGDAVEAPVADSPAPEDPPVEPADSTMMQADEVIRMLREIDEKIDAQHAVEAEEPELAEEVPADFQAMLDHDDPAVRDFARAQMERERSRTQKERELEARISSVEENDATAVAQAEIETARSKFSMSEEQVDAVTDLLCSDPALASRLSFEAGVRLLFPDLVARTMGSAPQPTVVKVAPGAGQPQAGQIITSGGTAGAVPTPWKPGPNETIESAVAAGARKLLGTD